MRVRRLWKLRDWTTIQSATCFSCFFSANTSGDTSGECRSGLSTATWVASCCSAETSMRSCKCTSLTAMSLANCRFSAALCKAFCFFVAPDLICFVACDGLILWLRPAALTMLGLKFFTASSLPLVRTVLWKLLTSSERAYWLFIFLNCCVAASSSRCVFV